MKNLRLLFDECGKAADVLKLECCEIPHLSQGQVLLKFHYSPINPADLNFIEGSYGLKPQLPAFPGLEGVASVLMSESTDFREQDLVIPIRRIGAWSEYAVTEAENLIRIPAEMDLCQAAMLKVNPATAWLLLHHFRSLHAGEWVCLNAANSGVGQCVIQIAKQLGIKTLCFTRSETHFPRLLDLGADAIFCDSIDGYQESIHYLSGQKVRLAFNAVGGESALRLAKLLERGGVHITYGAMGKKPLTITNGMFIFCDLNFRGFWLTQWLEYAAREEIDSLYDSLSTMILQGKLHQRIDQIFSLKEFGSAMERITSAERQGKVLLSLNLEK